MSLRLGIAQIHTRPGELVGTGERIVAQAQAAAARGVDLLVFPSATLSGPSSIPSARQAEFVYDAARMLAGLADRVACPCLVPLVVEIGSTLACNAVLIAHGSARLLFNVNQLGEDPGPVVFEHAGATVGLAFSYDGVYDFVTKKVDVIVCLSDLSFSIDDPAGALAASGDVRMVASATGAGTWLAVAATVGGYGPQVFLGASYIAAPDAALVAVAPACEEALVVADVGSGADMSARIARVPYDECYYLWQALVMGVRDHMALLAQDGVVLALDGGVASSALAVIATDALGPTRVHALPVPADGLSEAVDALVANLHIDRLPPVELGDAWGDATHDDLVSLALACAARLSNSIVLSTTDKTAWALGQSLLSAPVASFSPLADVLRSDLLAAAHVRNAISPVFPAASLAQPDLSVRVANAGSLSGEALLGQLDDVISAYVSGEPGMLARVDSSVASCALEAINAAMSAPMSPMVPFLMLSSSTLPEAQLPSGFGWVPTLRPMDGLSWPLDVGGAPEGASDRGAQDASDATAEGRASSAAPLDMGEVRGVLRETLDLIRDLSMGDTGGWPAPFSEN